MPTGKDGVEVKVEGVREFRRDLKRVPRDVDRNADDALKRNAELLAAEASARAPRVTGEYASGFTVMRARGGGYYVTNPLPQAGVLHWGGTIRPRGVDIRFPARPVISDALDKRADEIVDEVGDAFQRAARRAGFR